MHIAKLTTPDCPRAWAQCLSYSQAHIPYHYLLLLAWSPQKSWAHFPALPAKKQLREDTENTDTYFPQSTATRDLHEFLRITYTMFGAWSLLSWAALLDPRKDLGCQADLVSQRWSIGSQKGYWVPEVCLMLGKVFLSCVLLAIALLFMSVSEDVLLSWMSLSMPLTCPQYF